MVANHHPNESELNRCRVLLIKDPTLRSGVEHFTLQEDLHVTCWKKDSTYTRFSASNVPTKLNIAIIDHHLLLLGSFGSRANAQKI